MTRNFEEKFEKLAMEMLGYNIARAYNESKFEKLTIKKMEGGVTVEVDGQFFGLVGALGPAVANIAKISDTPLDQLLDYVKCYAMVIEKNVKDGKNPNEKDVTIDGSSLDGLMSAFSDMFDKKEEEQK